MDHRARPPRTAPATDLPTLDGVPSEVVEAVRLASEALDTIERARGHGAPPVDASISLDRSLHSEACPPAPSVD